MRNFVKGTIVGLFVWACVIWVVSFDPNQFVNWFKGALFLGSITAFFWWIFDFGNLIKEETKENV